MDCNLAAFESLRFTERAAPPPVYTHARRRRWGHSFFGVEDASFCELRPQAVAISFLTLRRNDNVV